MTNSEYYKDKICIVTGANSGIGYSLTEKLHFLTGLSCGYTAADTIVVAPDRTHYIIVFVLNGACFNGNAGGIFLIAFRKPG